MDGDQHDAITTLSRRYVWWICILLFLATLLNYLDRQVLALTADKVILDFGITKEQLGKVLAAFRYSYATFQIIGGWWVDSHGAGVIYPLAVTVWSLGAMGGGVARSVGMLTGSWFVLGFGEAFNWPCGLKVTQRLLPPRDRTLGIGIFNSGAAAGALLGPIIVTVIAVRYGWRTAFVVIGMLGLVWVLGWMVTVRGRTHQLGGDYIPPAAVVSIARGILAEPAFWILAVSSIIINGSLYFLADWIPLYLKTERGFSFSVGNALSMLVYAGLYAGNILSGIFVRWFATEGKPIGSARLRALALSCVLISLSMVAGLTRSDILALACLVLTALGVASFLVIYLTLVQEVDPQHVGTTAGLLGGIGNLAYGFLSPYIGRLADLKQMTLTLVIIGASCWLAFGAIVLGAKRLRS